jgi:hypothetical protein
MERETFYLTIEGLGIKNKRKISVFPWQIMMISVHGHHINGERSGSLVKCHSL